MGRAQQSWQEQITIINGCASETKSGEAGRGLGVRRKSREA
jgi:hypothetical protein